MIEYKDFWNKEIDVSTLAKRVLNMLYGMSEHHIYIGDRNTGKTLVQDSKAYLYLLSTGWKPLPRHFNFIPSSTLIEILSDGSDNGFEFKVNNGMMYYRECEYQNTDSIQDID